MKYFNAKLAFVLLFVLGACSAAAPPPLDTQSEQMEVSTQSPTPTEILEPTQAPEPTAASVEEKDEETVSGTLVDDTSILIGTWHGQGGGWMVLRPDGSFRGAFNERELVNTKPGDNGFWNGTYRLEDGQIVFVENSNRGCSDDQEGVYQGYITDDGLVFTLVSDDCTQRINTLLGQRVEPVIDIVWEKTSDEAPYAMGWFRSIELPFIPHDIALDAAGNLYAVELGAPTVHKLDGEGNVLSSWGESGSEAGQFAFAPPPDGPPLDGGFVVVGIDGSVYISDSYNNRVQIFDPDGNFLTMWESSGPEATHFNIPGPISVDEQGNVYVADFNGIQQFDAGGNFIQTISAGGEVAFDSEGNMFTVVAFENFAMKVPSGGGEPVIWGGEGMGNGQFITPMWVVVGEDGTVTISDHSGRVQRFDSDGNFMAVWSDPANGDGPLTAPSPLGQDAEGNIYIGTKDRTTVYVLRP